MSETKQNPLDAILAQYEKNSKPKFSKNDNKKTYDLKNYFSPRLEKGVDSAMKTIRILPNSDGSSPFTEIHGHKAQVEGEFKTFACLKEHKNSACPFCEARELLLATGKDSDKKLARDYSSRLLYVVKVIDRENEADGVKFWRFNNDYTKNGAYDKILGLVRALKKDIFNSQTGRDLVLSINRNQNDIPVVTSITAMDPSPISENAEEATTWLSDTRTWEDVYSTKSYDYLELVVKGFTPVWDKNTNKYVAKEAGVTSKADDLNSELTIGVENVKNNIKTASVATATTAAPSVSSESDDLLF